MMIGEENCGGHFDCGLRSHASGGPRHGRLGEVGKSDVADFVDHVRSDRAKSYKFVGRCLGRVRGFETGDPIDRGGESDPVTGSGGLARVAGGPYSTTVWAGGRR